MAGDPKQTYNELFVIIKEAQMLGYVNALLGWDEQTYMPKGSAESGPRYERKDIDIPESCAASS